MANEKISDLTQGAIDAGSLFEHSRPDGVGGYDTKSASFTNLRLSLVELNDFGKCELKVTHGFAFANLFEVIPVSMILNGGNITGSTNGFTIGEDGIYIITASVAFFSTGSGHRDIMLCLVDFGVGNVADSTRISKASQQNTHWVNFSTTWLEQLSSGQNIELHGQVSNVDVELEPNTLLNPEAVTASFTIYRIA